jgi:PAS domain S-box-containing protein
MLLLELIHNLALLISISVLYDLVGVVPKKSSPIPRLLAGLLFGAAGVVGMMSPMQFAPGVIYDGRSIILTAAGLMTGAGGGVLAAIPALAYRIYLGGAGTVAGVSVILTSVSMGIAAFYLRRRYPWWNSTTALVILGVAVHALMLIWQLLFLPERVATEVLEQVGLLILLVFPVAFVLVGRFLLDREQSRALAAEAHRADRLYRSLFENTHAVMFAIRPEDGAILDANPAAEEFYGWSRDELRRMKVYEINTLSEEEAKAEIERARRARQEYFEFRHRLADGSVRDVAVRSGGAPVGGEEVLHSVVFDITTRKAAERERDLMLFGMDHAALGVMRIRESDGVVEEANRKACELLGYKREEVEGMRVFTFDKTLTEEGWRKHRERVRDAREYTFETVHLRKDGSEYPAEVTVAYVQYGGTDYSFSFFQDITLRKKHEEAIEANLKEKESLLREIHHRVKNNLAVISSLINLQEGRAGSWEEAQAALEKTKDRINTMGEVHNNLYSSGNLSQLDFCEFLQQRAERLSLSYRNGRSISLVLECPRITVDVEIAIPLGLVLNELVTNAYKHAFGGDGGGEIRVSVAEKREALLLRVEDNGTGLPASAAEEGGSIGLQLVNLLVEQINGTVRLITGEGTRAEVSVPPKD